MLAKHLNVAYNFCSHEQIFAYGRFDYKHGKAAVKVSWLMLVPSL